jgi:hypothetical protein
LKPECSGHLRNSRTPFEYCSLNELKALSTWKSVFENLLRVSSSPSVASALIRTNTRDTNSHHVANKLATMLTHHIAAAKSIVRTRVPRLAFFHDQVTRFFSAICLTAIATISKQQREVA